MKHGWWSLDWNIEGDELTDIDREHIAKKITEGFTEGELIHTEENE